MYRIKAGEDIEILTEKGESVKSKSEKIIADKLNMMNIPYCYEVPLYLKGYGYVKPDFKVLNVATRKEYYWEHYGMMDNKDYIIKALKKKKPVGFLQANGTTTTASDFPAPGFFCNIPVR